MSFTNVYYKRTTATSKPCYVCYKPTPIVLATVNTVDFLYTCESHLKDRGFVSLIENETPKPTVSAEEIARVKAEYEESQKRKKEKEKEKEKDKAKSEGDDKKNKDDSAKEIPRTIASPPLPTTPTATHQKYALHRDFYAIRQNEHRKRRQAAQAKALAPRLPGAPKGTI